MKVSRRDFLKISAGAGAAATFMSTDVLQKAMAVITQNNNDLNLVWIHGQACTGCTISALSWVGDVSAGGAGLGAGYTTNLLQVLSATSTDLEFHPTLMPQAGAYYTNDGETYEPYAGLVADNSGDEDQIYVDAIEYLKDVVDNTSQETFVIVEGAIPYEKWGDNEEPGFCEVGMENVGGTYKEGHMWEFADIVRYCHDADGVTAFIAYGNCGAFGGIPGGNPNPTGAKGLQHFIEDAASVGQFGYSIEGYGSTNHKPVINLTDCPAHPEHLVLTYAAILQSLAGPGGYFDYIRFDQWNRPAEITLDGSSWYNIYGKPTHDECERIAAFDTGDFATSFADAIEYPNKCLLRLGCRGVIAHTNCSYKGGFTEGPAPNGWNPAGVGNWNKDRDNEFGTANPGSWCVAQGSPCYGCADVSFPDNVFGSGFFRECTHSEMLAGGKIPGEASGATPDYEGKGLVCYTCHATSMPRNNKEWINNTGTVGYGSGYGGSGGEY